MISGSGNQRMKEKKVIAHMSIPAKDPKATALFFAAVIDGQAFEFPVVPGAWIAVAKDNSGLAIEVYPRTMAHHPGTGVFNPSLMPDGPRAMPWEDQIFPEQEQTGPTGFHLAIATKIPQEQVIALAKAAGWRALSCERAGVFGVIEVWLDNLVLVELLTPNEVERYRQFMNPVGCRAMFGEGIDPNAIAVAAVRD